MDKVVKINNPYVISDTDSNTYYCYGDDDTMYSSADLIKWKKISSSLPKLKEPAAVKVRNEYRIYSVEDDGIILYSSASPSENFEKRDYVVCSDNCLNSISPSIFVDENTREHYLVYTRKGEGIFLLHLNPRNGLAFVEGPGVNIAKGPAFNSMISNGFIFYNNDNGFYYLFAVYGSPLTGNIRVGRSHELEGPYLDYDGYELTDINDFSGIRGYLADAPHLFDGMPAVSGYSRPVIINKDDGGQFMTCGIHLWDNSQNGKNKSVLGTENLMWNNGWPLLIPYGLIKIDEERHFTSRDIYGKYEFIKYNKSLLQPMLDYVALFILAPREQGVSSTRNSWAMKVPHSAGGRTELGGSHRGYWVYTEDNRVMMELGMNTENYNIIPVRNTMTDEDTLLLIGTDTHGIVAVAKKYQ